MNQSRFGKLDGDSNDGIGVESGFSVGEVGESLSETEDFGGIDFGGEGTAKKKGRSA